jgi:hypothetical protein
LFLLRTRIVAIAAAAALAAVTALQVSPAEAQSDCAFSKAGTLCGLENGYGFWAAGDTHGEDVYADPTNGTRYAFHPYETVGGETYGGISNGNGALCWNTDYPDNPDIGLDSCQYAKGDANELFAMVPCGDGAWCMNNLNWGPDSKVFGYPADSDLMLLSGVGLNGADEWDAVT